MGVNGHSGELPKGGCGVKSNAKPSEPSVSLGGANRTERDFVSRELPIDVDLFGWGV